MPTLNILCVSCVFQLSETHDFIYFILLFSFPVPTVSGFSMWTWGFRCLCWRAADFLTSGRLVSRRLTRASLSDQTDWPASENIRAQMIDRKSKSEASKSAGTGLYAYKVTRIIKLSSLTNRTKSCAIYMEHSPYFVCHESATTLSVGSSVILQIGLSLTRCVLSSAVCPRQ